MKFEAKKMDMEKLIKNWKMTLTFEELMDFIGAKGTVKEELLKLYNSQDKPFKTFIDELINQSFLLGKLQGGEEVKNMISEFLKVSFDLDFLDHLKLNDRLSIFNAKQKL